MTNIPNPDYVSALYEEAGIIHKNEVKDFIETMKKYYPNFRFVTRVCGSYPDYVTYRFKQTK